MVVLGGGGGGVGGCRKPGGEGGLREGDSVSHKVEMQDNTTVVIGRDRL